MPTNLRLQQLKKQFIHSALLAKLKFLYFLSGLNLRRQSEQEHFLNIVYRVLLKRPIDSDGLEHFSQIMKIRHGKKIVVNQILQSTEFKDLHNIPVFPLECLHEARIDLIKNHIPQAQRIVDLGGGSTDFQEGALLAMGYPYRPQKIYIIDLPPEHRMLKSAEQTTQFVTDEGVEIEYLYQSMTDFRPLQDTSIDMVFSGESIEHISETDGDIVCEQAFRVLKPGGYFCLDTPNAALTRLQSPHEFIHPEHKIEYKVDQLIEKLKKWGFEVVESRGLCAMPQSLETGRFKLDEIVKNRGVFADPENCYLFFVKAIKPMN